MHAASLKVSLRARTRPAQRREAGARTHPEDDGGPWRRVNSLRAECPARGLPREAQDLPELGVQRTHHDRVSAQPRPGAGQEGSAGAPKVRLEPSSPQKVPEGQRRLSAGEFWARKAQTESQEGLFEPECGSDQAPSKDSALPPTPAWPHPHCPAHQSS